MTALRIEPPSITVRAPAKINLHLGVGPVRPDGYHPLATVYQAIGLYDDVTATMAESWSVEVSSGHDIDCSGVPLDDTNLAVRAGQLLLGHHGVQGGAYLHIAKGIPVAGGLAGGSADAAATLVAIDRIYDLQTSDDDLLRLAGELGSDVPFALLGGTALGTGRGELVEPVEDAGSWWWVVVPSEPGLSTPEVYRTFDDGFAGGLERPDELLNALSATDPAALGPALRNDLQAPAMSLRADLAATVDRLTASSALGVLVSGSGPTCVALTADADHARELSGELLAEGFDRVLCAPGPVSGVHLVEWD